MENKENNYMHFKESSNGYILIEDDPFSCEPKSLINNIRFLKPINTMVC